MGGPRWTIRYLFAPIIVPAAAGVKRAQRGFVEGRRCTVRLVDEED
jgi:hypothetical protein